MENTVCQLHKGSKEWNMVIDRYAELLKATAVMQHVAGAWAKKHEPKLFTMPFGASNCRCAIGFKFDEDKPLPEVFVEVMAYEDSRAPAYVLGSARNGDEPLGVFDTSGEAAVAVFAGLFMSEVYEKVKKANYQPDAYVGAVLHVTAKDTISVSLVPDWRGDGSTGVSLEMPGGVSTANFEQAESGYRVKFPTSSATISDTGKSACSREGAALLALLRLFSGLLIEGMAMQASKADHLNS
jgi:hypothetical protein